MDSDYEENKITPIDVEKACELISAGGALDSISENFEQRDSQIELLENICKVFNESKIGIFEAGTGVGKSFAYLIPAILWVANNKERVVISTGTINLQQQIFEKDLPLAQKITGKKVNAVLMKGRQNFICLRRFFDLSKENDLFNEDIENIDKIKEWLETTTTGNKSDLPFELSEGFWQRINSESDACLSNRCAHKNECFVMKMKKLANSAQIIIVNHHLLFADVQMRSKNGFENTAVLPPYTRVIFDEAHGMENAATSFFSETLTKFTLQKQIRLLYKNRHGNQSGLFFTIDALSLGNTDISQLLKLLSEFENHLTLLEENSKILLKNSYTVRLSSENQAVSVDVLLSLKKVSQDLRKIITFFNDALSCLTDEDSENDSVWEVRQVLRRLEEYSNFCDNFANYYQFTDRVFWLENGNYIRFHETPIDISNFLFSSLFEQFESVVCVSATLSIANSFNFWLSRVGLNLLENNRIELGQFSSPFPYHKNVLFSVPTDAESPLSHSFQAYVEDALPKLIRASYGRALVLFTSLDSLKHAYEACKTYLATDDFVLLKQGDMDRFKLLEKFKNDVSSVLFATYSFWEGIDVPGESLSHVIIVKLPFGVPSDPIFASRCEDIERRGGNSFMELSVPESIIKFKQGFGRLMRRNTDFGCVTVLDKRLIEKYYGKAFIESIPQTKQIFDTTNEICKRIENFLS